VGTETLICGTSGVAVKNGVGVKVGGGVIVSVGVNVGGSGVNVSVGSDMIANAVIDNAS